MLIEAVNNIQDAEKCDELLTKLIQSEGDYDENIKKDYAVKNYFSQMFNDGKYSCDNNCNDAILYIAKSDENVVVAYAYCKIVSEENGPMKLKVSLIDGVYVELKYRKKGIATALINKCKEWRKKVGAKYIEINVLNSNKSAKMLYERIGFENHEIKMRQVL